LADALRRRDAPTRDAVRSALSALDNAAAVPAAETVAPGSAHVAGSVAFGGAEARRRRLSSGESRRLIEREVDEREAAAAFHEAAGDAANAERLRLGAEALRGILKEGTSVPRR
jgi:hypothetical protein